MFLIYDRNLRDTLILLAYLALLSGDSFLKCLYSRSFACSVPADLLPDCSLKVGSGLERNILSMDVNWDKSDCFVQLLQILLPTVRN